MEFVDLPLEEVIVVNRKRRQNKSGARGGKFGGSAHQNGPRRSQNSGHPNSKKFGGSAADNGQNGRKTAKKGNKKDNMVRINLSNMAATVTTCDLQELFEKYNAESANVHFNQNGESLRTGDVVLPKKDAARAVQDFDGIAIDGEIIEMVILDGSLMNSGRVQFPSQFPKKQISRGGVQKRGGKKGGNRKGTQVLPGTKGKGGTKRENKPKKTIEELDAELEEYMAQAE